MHIRTSAAGPIALTETTIPELIAARTTLGKGTRWYMNMWTQHLCVCLWVEEIHRWGMSRQASPGRSQASGRSTSGHAVNREVSHQVSEYPVVHLRALLEWADGVN